MATTVRAPTPSHITVDAWPLVGQTAEEAARSNSQLNNSIGNTTNSTGSTTGSITTTTTTPTTTSKTSLQPNTTRALNAAPIPRRSAWGPPDPPPRPPSKTGVAPTSSSNRASSAAVLPPSPLHIPPLNTSVAISSTSSTGNGSNNATPNGNSSRHALRGPSPSASGATAASGANNNNSNTTPGIVPVMDESDVHVCLGRVQEYYVLAFQRSPHDFLVNFFTNMAFQAGVLSAGLSPDVSTQANPKLINTFAHILNNDHVFYVHHAAAAAAASAANNFSDWVANSSSTPPPQSSNSPRVAPPRSPATTNRHQNGGSATNATATNASGGRQQRQGGAGPTARPNGINHGQGYRAVVQPSVNGTPSPHFVPPFTPVAIFHHLQPGFPPSIHHVTTRVTSRSLVKVPAIPPIAVAAPHIVATLQRECARMIPSIQPIEEERRRRTLLIAHLQKAVKAEWSGATVSCFGSAANGLALAQGDVDICVIVPKGARKLYRGAVVKGKNQHQQQYQSEIKAENEVQVLRSIKDLLLRNNFDIRSDLCHARVPILKLYDPKSGFQIDMCVNNRLVDHNTALVGRYMELDDRVRPLCLLIKSWAKNRDVNTTYRGTLSSYAYVLLVISFCQTRHPPVLPCLQRMVDGRVVKEGEKLPENLVSHSDKSSEAPTQYNVYFDRSSKVTWESRNQDSLAQLLLAFFKYYTFEFDYNKSVVSVRTGGLITRESKSWDQKSVQADAEEAEREFREDRAAEEMEEAAFAIAEAQRRRNLEQQQSNGVDAETIDLEMGKVMLDADAAPFLPVSPSKTQSRENESSGSTCEKEKESIVQSQPVSSKSASVRSQDSVKSDSNEEAVAVVAKAVVDLEKGVGKLAVSNGATVRSSDSVSSSVTSADASPAVPTLTSPPSETASSTTSNRTLFKPMPVVRDRLRKPRPVERHAFCIEDPFNLSHDLSRGADEDTIYVIREEFYRAYMILSETGNLGNALMPLHLDVPFPIVSPGVGRTLPPTPTPPPPLAVAGNIATTTVVPSPNNSMGNGRSGGGNRGNHHHGHRRNGGGGGANSGRNGGSGGYGRQRHYTNRQGGGGGNGNSGRAGGQHRIRSNLAGSPRNGAQR